MTQALSTEQLNQLVQNTVIVLLARPDLVHEWHTNLSNLLKQARDAALEDETLFIAAVLALLNHPKDTLPTGTCYDRAWQSIVVGLQTGVVQPVTPAVGEDENLSLERLLNSVVQAVTTVLTRMPEHHAVLKEELDEMSGAASRAGLKELVTWLANVRALLNGVPPQGLGAGHQGVYAIYWEMLVKFIQRSE